MSYTKQNFYKGMTLTSTHLNHMEDAIFVLSKGGIVWYTDVTSTDSLDRVAGNASRGWAYGLNEDLNAIRGVPINLAKFVTTSTSGIVTIGIAPSLNATTFSKTLTTSFTKTNSNKEVVTVQFDETIVLGEEEVLVIEPYLNKDDLTNSTERDYVSYYGSVEGHNAFYSRIPNDLDGNGENPWKYTERCIGWSFGYTLAEKGEDTSYSIKVDNNMDSNSMNPVANQAIKKYIDSETSLRGIEYFHYDFVNSSTLNDAKLSGGYSNSHLVEGKGYALQSYANRLLFKHNIDIDYIKIVADVTLTDNTAVLTLGSKTYSGTVHSSCITFNFNTGKMIFAKKSNDTTIAAAYRTVDFSSITNSGDLKYLIEVGRRRRCLYAAVTNYRTGKRFEEVITEETEELSKYPAGWLYDEPTIAQIGGTQAYLRNIRCYVPTDAKAVFVGDSITEGWGVLAKDNWANMCCEYFGNSVNMGRSGARLFIHTQKQLEDLLPFVKPKYVVVTIGSNDSLTTTKEHYETMINFIKSTGATLILNYIYMKEPAKNNEVFYINDIIESLNIVGSRFDYATSIDNDLNKNQNASLFVSDQLHLNAVGNKAVFERFVTDCGFISFLK